MSCKIQRKETGLFRPVVWRRIAAAPHHTSVLEKRKDEAGDSSRELEEQRARAVEMEQAAGRAEEAYQRGLREGEASARQRLAAETTAMLQRLGRTIGEVPDLRARVLRQSESDVVQLAMAIARRVLHRELTIDPEALSNIVGAALAKLRAHEVYRVRVHAGDAEVVRAAIQQSGRSAQVEVTSDPTQARGAAIFETHQGKLDASVETQLREIERGLADGLSKL